MQGEQVHPLGSAHLHSHLHGMVSKMSAVVFAAGAAAGPQDRALAGSGASPARGRSDAHRAGCGPECRQCAAC
jgi:hypothetical protein